MTAEDQRLRSPVGLSRLHEDTTCQSETPAGLSHGPREQLELPPNQSHVCSDRGPRYPESFLTQHDGVDDESDDVLRDEECDGGRTLLRDHPPPEADGHLNLDGEQEG